MSLTADCQPGDRPLPTPLTRLVGQIDQRRDADTQACLEAQRLQPNGLLMHLSPEPHTATANLS